MQYNCVEPPVVIFLHSFIQFNLSLSFNLSPICMLHGSFQKKKKKRLNHFQTRGEESDKQNQLSVLQCT